VTIPITWTVAGSDSGGGAGIQADLKVMTLLGTHACSVITALTAQNTQGVRLAEPVCPAMLEAQLAALAEDLPPTALKSGMLWNAAVIHTLARFLRETSFSPRPVYVCDPVLLSTSGHALIEPAAVTALRRELFPLAALLTPNLPEARALTGLNSNDPETLAAALLENGCHSVLIKGGHADGPRCADYWTDGKAALLLRSRRIETRSTHGTGCSLSAAITAFAALGYPLPEAISRAKSYITQCLRTAPGLGAGHGPLRFAPWLDHPDDRPETENQPFSGPGAACVPADK